ncbi:hypothetical protein GJV85_11430 [Sulfurimonas aquatica]|uniref:LPP20 family lipoprotein n=1 Tax=Sulfurimonas aquatica TaxID=2672570 RepID=A0A975GDG3_9BACT|nr:hypothetical protein [Sulfurimonas aquatica]QSZ42696.1 hypothetical protein GJV85_11430 [Sulfurimonas aquatica]
MRVVLSTLLFLVLFLVGCNSQPAPSSNNAKPSWIMNPNQDGKIGAVGVANRTYDQKPSSQRKLAITRALDELTLQQGVDVSLNIDKRNTVVNDKSSLTMDTKSSYSASSSVTAHIEKVWQNKMTNELYIWMVMD